MKIFELYIPALKRKIRSLFLIFFAFTAMEWLLLEFAYDFFPAETKVFAPFILAARIFNILLLAGAFAGFFFLFRNVIAGDFGGLETLELWYRAVLQRAADGIVIFDEKGLIEYVNPTAERLFSVRGEDVAGQSIQLIMPGYTGVFDVVQEEPELSYTAVGKELVGRKWNGSTFHMDLSLSELRHEDRQVYMAIIRDITSRKETEEALKESEESFRRLVDVFPDTVTIHSEGKIVFVNPAGIKLLGAANSGELLGRNVLEFVSPDHRDLVSDRIRAMREHNDSAPLTEEKFVRLDGSALDVEVTATPFSYHGKPAIQVVARDITERKQAEDQIKKSLREKDVLIKEIHHRVKNNLQVILSLLDLQEDYSENVEPLEILRECQNRVKSIALIHEQLYRSTDFESIDFPEYLRSLTDNVFRSYGVPSDGIRLKIEVTGPSIGLNTAIPCGLIVHELVSNSLKHAFFGVKNGEIRIGLHSDDDRYFLVVSDNGAGFPDGTDYRSFNSLGLQLVSTLTSQIQGSIDFHSGAGTEYIISFRPTD